MTHLIHFILPLGIFFCYLIARRRTCTLKQIGFLTILILFVAIHLFHAPLMLSISQLHASGDHQCCMPFLSSGNVLQLAAPVARLVKLPEQIPEAIGYTYEYTLHDKSPPVTA